MISFIKKSIKAYKNIIVLLFASVVLMVYLLTFNTAQLFPSLENERKVLSYLIYSPEIGAERYQIFKVKNKNKILVEVYKVINESTFEPVSHIDTGSKYEGYFLLGGNATNLAYINIDDDPLHEIIVPGFDSNLAAQLNVIKFDTNTKSFSLVNERISLENP